MRAWHELVADLADPVPGGVTTLALLLIIFASLVAVLWYWWPHWVPARRGASSGRRHRGWWRLRFPPLRRWWQALRRNRFRALLRWRMRRRWRARRRPDPRPQPDLSPEELPRQPAAVMALSADELAAQGRYREAVRQRLRAIVRDLVERQVVEHHPGWTVTELARMAGAARPSTAAPLAGACEVFSRIWYGQHPAGADDDAAMRVYAGQVRSVLGDQPVRAAAGQAWPPAGGIGAPA